MKIIKKESDEAVTYRTDICGWVDRHGYFFGEDEEDARVSGSTHNSCKNCHKLIDKCDVICKDCKEQAEIETYNKREKSKWVSDDVVYSDKYGVYFFNVDDIVDYVNDNISEFDFSSFDDLRLVLCEKVSLGNIDSDLWWDELSDTDGIPELQTAIDDFNNTLDGIDINLWEPGTYRVSFYEVDCD